MEINEIKKDTLDKTKVWFIEEIKTIYKFLERLTKNKRKITKISEFRYKKGDKTEI